MDYDGNDFQGQKLQLAGEGSAKLSSVLHPYPLPKFDFDDSLRGHLRFDTLVESEVFLGIPSQEYSQWIEDFSRGASGIEFSPSAAESCSISRHINVWSEATSSESVEMLLKSVGSSNAVDPDAVSENCSLIVTTESMGIDRKYDDSHQREADALANESLNYKNRQDPFVSEVQISNINSSWRTVTARVGNLNERKIPHKASDVCSENVNALSKGTCKIVMEHNVPSQKANMDDQVLSKTKSAICAYSMDTPHCVSSKVEFFEKSTSNVFVETSSLQLCKEKRFEQDDSTGTKCGVIGSLESDKRVGSSSSGEVVKDNVVIVDGSEFNTTLANSPGANNLASCEREAVADESKKLEKSPFLCDLGHLAIKEGDGAEAVALEKHKEASVEGNHEVAFLKIAVDISNDHTASFGLVHSSECDASLILEAGRNVADSDKSNCDSSIVIGCIKPSNSDRDKKESVKVVMVENVPLSESSTGVDGTVQLIPMRVRGDGSSNKERNFTCEVSKTVGLTDIETSTILVGSPSTSGGGQMEAKGMKEISRGPPQVSDGMIRDVDAKVTPTRKPRRGSQMDANISEDVSCGTPQGFDGMIPHRGAKKGKENDKNGKHAKEATPVKQLETWTGQLVQSEELKSDGNVKSIGAIPPGVISVPTSNLLDLNTSVPPSVLFQQPFTDVQQVQLGAQILVYGSLIQGAVPDGACMVSAFGPSDGTGHVWESTWHACLERLHALKSHANNSEDPAQSCSGTRTLHQASRQGPLQHKVVSSPVGRARSPLLGVHQALSPLHPKQAPPLQNFVGHNPSLLSQAFFTGPWVASPQNSSFDAGAHFSGFPVKESSLLVSATKHVSPIPMAHNVGPNTPAGPSLLEAKKEKASPGQHSADSKARKRKRVPVTVDHGQISFPQNKIESASSHLVKKVCLTEDLGQISLLARSRAELVSAPLSHFSTSVTVTGATCSASEGNLGQILSPVSPCDHPQKGNQTLENKDMVSTEMPNKVEEAMVQAEEAVEAMTQAEEPAGAVNRSQDVWSQLDKQKNSALVFEMEAMLASAAVTISAAAAVAKAAAAAAKIASDAALQAKLMADEVFSSIENGKSTQNADFSLPDVVNNLGKVTSSTILKGGDGSNCSSSIIIAAREAARRRVEAASAASKHAENLDAIVKAAELTAEAVSQARKILATGDPSPLSELVESVPEEQGFSSNNVNRDLSNSNIVENVPCPSAKQLNGGPSDTEMHTMNHDGMSPLPRLISRDLKDDRMRVVDGISSPFRCCDKDSRGQRGHKASELAQTMLVVPEPEFGLRPTFGNSRDECKNAIGLSKQNGITKGCFVEVLKDVGNCKAAWFSAKVLSLGDGRAFVGYTDLQSDEGSEQLKELVPLEDDGDKQPRIRIAHPITTMPSEGRRKRRREAITDYSWAVGDRVDAWMQNCWCEGVVTEKKNETTLTVHFPVKGETLVVRSWDLRPTLLWKDGEWIEWPRSKGDAPLEKRLKPGSPVIDGKMNYKDSKDINLSEYDYEKILDVDNNDTVENNLEGLRRKRMGLQKGVNIGVPKPGKNTKFMEVNKHFVSHGSGMNNLSNDSVKFARYLMPRGSRERKNNSRTLLPQKDRLLNSAKSGLSDVTATGSACNDAKRFGKQKLMEFGFCSDTEEVVEGPVLFSSQALLPDDSSEEISLLNAKSERVNKGRHAEEVSRKSTSVEVRAKSVLETRRSHRRIQPTSRLLEGLQSSLIASKIPPVSNDKTHRSQNRATTPKGNNNHG
ncbi:hypothetical protein LguiB_034510 [Lonicera macranthoides]